MPHERFGDGTCLQRLGLDIHRTLSRIALFVTHLTFPIVLVLKILTKPEDSCYCSKSVQEKFNKLGVTDVTKRHLGGSFRRFSPAQTHVLETQTWVFLFHIAEKIDRFAVAINLFRLSHALQ